MDTVATPQPSAKAGFVVSTWVKVLLGVVAAVLITVILVSSGIVRPPQSAITPPPAPINIDFSTLREVDKEAFITAILEGGVITNAQIVDGTITAEKLAPGAVIEYPDGETGSPNITEGTITNWHLGDGSVTTAKIINEAVTSVQLADGSVTTVKIREGAVTSSKIANGTIQLEDLAFTIPTGSSGTTATATIADGSVTSVKIAGGAVTNSKISDNAIDGSKVSDGSLTGADIQNGSILNADLANLSVTAAKIATGTITADKLVNDGTIVKSILGTSSLIATNNGDGSYSLTLTTSCGDGEVLSWDTGGSEWVCTVVAGGVTELADLSDVGTATPTSGNILIANGSSWNTSSTTAITSLGTITTGVWQASAIDISSYTNLSAGTNISLVGDTLNVDDAFLLNTGDTGSGAYTFSGTFDLVASILQGANALQFEGATSNAFQTTLQITDPTADRTLILPDASGTIALLSDISGGGLSTTGDTGNGAYIFTGTMDFTGTVLQGANALVFEGGTADANELTLSIATLTTDRTITLPDASGTILLDSTLGTTSYLQGGNAYGALAVIGTTDTNALSIITDSIERIRVSVGGDVMIGTGTAAASLHVQRTDGSAKLLVEETSASIASRQLLQLANTGGVQFALTNTDSGDEWVIANETSGFHIDNSAIGATPELTIDPSGNVGLGTTTPNEKLTVDGAISLAAGSAPSATAGYGKLYVDSTDGQLKYIDPTGEEFAMNEIEHLIKDFIVKEGEMIAAGDVVSLSAGEVVKGMSVNNTKIEANYSPGPAPDAKIVALDSSTFVLAWADEQSGTGKAVVGTVSGNSISYGDIYVFRNSDAINIGLAAISSTQFVVAFEDDPLSQQFAIVGTNTGGVLSFGTPTMYQSSSSTGRAFDITALDSNTVVIVNTHSSDVYAAVGTISGTSITMGTNTLIAAPASGTPWVGIDALDSTRFVLVYGDSSTDSFVTIGTISGLTFSLGTIYNYYAGGNQYNDVAALDTNKFVIAYQDTDGGFDGELRVGDVTGGNVISLGTPATFATPSEVSWPSIQAISTTQFSIAYRHIVGAAFSTSVFVGTISGSSLSTGTINPFDTHTNLSAMTSVLLSGTKIVSAYSPGTGTDTINLAGQELTTIAGTISGESVSFGTNTPVGVYEDADGISIAKLTSNSFLAVYETDSTQYQVVAQLFTISGGEIVFSPAYEFLSSVEVDEIDIAVLSSTSFVISSTTTSGGNPFVMAGSISGSVITSAGTITLLSGATVPERVWVEPMTSTTFVAVYRDGGQSGRAEAQAGSVSGVSVALGTAVAIDGTVLTGNLGLARTDDNRFLVAYRDSTGDGTARIGTVSGTAVTVGAETDFYTGGDIGFNGLYAESYSTDKVAIVVSNDANSDAGELYLANTTGATATYSSAFEFDPSTENPHVVALSTTRLVIVYEDFSSADLEMVTATILTDTSVSLSSSQLITSDYNASRDFAIATRNTTDYFLGYVDGTADFLGVLQLNSVISPVAGIAVDAGTGGSTIQVIIDGISNSHSGLVAGETYWSDSAGALSTAQSATSDIFVGVAISPTELFLSTGSDFSNKFFGDQHFANNFRITEATSYQGLIYVNQLNKEILSLDESGGLSAKGNIAGKSLTGRDLSEGSLCATATGVIANCSANDSAKTNVSDYDDALEVLMGLRPVGFDWTSGSLGQVGLIASEVASVDPNLVTYYEEELKDIDYKQLTALLIRGLQQTQEQIQAVALGQDLQGNLAVIQATDLKVSGAATFAGNITVKGQVELGADNVGEVEFLAGDTEVEVQFSKEYGEKPVITITPLGNVSGTYWVSDIDRRGFKIYISDQQLSDLRFSWHAFGSAGGKIFFSDGEVEDI